MHGWIASVLQTFTPINRLKIRRLYDVDVRFYRDDDL